MKDKIVNSANAGFSYQELFGARLLLDLKNNILKDVKYIVIEAKDGSNVPNALDDIVVYKKNKKRDYYQVKYTPNTKNNFLDLKFLLDSKFNILKNMYSGFLEVCDTVDNIYLLTNKIESSDFEDILTKDKKIDFNFIDNEYLNKIEKFENYNEKDFKAFLNLLTFKKEKDFSNLKNEIIDSLKSEGKDPYIFFDFVSKKANIKETDSDTRFITKEHIINLYNKNNEFLNQKFKTPLNYSRNTNSFNKLNQEIKKTLKENKKFLFLYGKPGSGKSSLLSDFCDEKIYPTIRHHYYLSLEENQKHDRYNNNKIKESLNNQLKNICPNIDVEDNFIFNIELVCKKLAEENSNLIILLDGLDHVSRDNNNDIEPLVKIIEELKDVDMKNLLIILGSQELENNLESSILDISISSQIEIENLSFDDFKNVFNNIKINLESDYSKDSFFKDLYEKTKGYPLSIQCVVKKLKESKVISKRNIDLLVEYKGNVNDYYDELLSNLNQKEKFFISILCNYNYLIDGKYINEIYKEENKNKKSIISFKGIDYSKINYLLNKNNLFGLMPFHDSLNVYIIENKKYKLTKKNKKALKDWLNSNAPEYLKELYLDRYKTKQELIKEMKIININWLSERIARGYPLYLLKNKLLFLVEKSKEYKKLSIFYKMIGYYLKILNLYNLRVHYLDQDILINELMKNKDIFHRYLFDLNIHGYEYDKIMLVSKVLINKKEKEYDNIKIEIKNAILKKYELMKAKTYSNDDDDCYNQDDILIELFYLLLDKIKLKNIKEIDYYFLDILFEFELNDKIEYLIEKGNHDISNYLTKQKTIKKELDRNIVGDLNKIFRDEFDEINNNLNRIKIKEIKIKEIKDLIYLSNFIKKRYKKDILTKKQKYKIISLLKNEDVIKNDIASEWETNCIYSLLFYFTNNKKYLNDYFRLKLSYAYKKDQSIFPLLYSLKCIIENKKLKNLLGEESIIGILNIINKMDLFTTLEELENGLLQFYLILEKFYPNLLEEYKFKNFDSYLLDREILPYNKNNDILKGHEFYKESNSKYIEDLKNKNNSWKDILDNHSIFISFESLIKMLIIYEENKEALNLMNGMIDVFKEETDFLIKNK